jgi:hypothetical protein
MAALSGVNPSQMRLRIGYLNTTGEAEKLIEGK